MQYINVHPSFYVIILYALPLHMLCIYVIISKDGNIIIPWMPRTPFRQINQRLVLRNCTFSMRTFVANISLADNMTSSCSVLLL